MTVETAAPFSATDSVHEMFIKVSETPYSDQEAALAWSDAQGAAAEDRQHERERADDEEIAPEGQRQRLQRDSS